MSSVASASIIIRAPRERVWDALTNPAVVKQYFFGTDLEADWKVGSPIYFRGAWQGKRYEDRGTVLQYEPPKTLAYSYWSSMSGLEDRPELRQTVHFALDDAPDGVLLTVRQTNVPTVAAADHSAENWRMVLAGMKKLLEG